MLGNKHQHQQQRHPSTTATIIRRLFLPRSHQPTSSKESAGHFFKHPHHAPKAPHHHPRIPKRVRGPLVLDKLSTEREGYGLRIHECVSWTRVVILEAIITIACVSFAVFWCFEKNGGIQDGCAVAGIGLACGNIILGAFQAVA